MTTPMLTACSAPEPSPESQFIQQRLVPALTARTQRSRDTIRLSDILHSQPGALFCVVNEYKDLTYLTSMADIEIDEYRSAFGYSVPETHQAIVLVIDDVAHAGSVYYEHVFIATDSIHGGCVRVADAQLAFRQEWVAGRLNHEWWLEPRGEQRQGQQQALVS